MVSALSIQRYNGTRSRHRRWRSLGFGEISPTSIPEDFPETENPLELASLRKDALLANFVPKSVQINNIETFLKPFDNKCRL